MKTYLYISIGGFLGAILRFVVKNMYLGSNYAIPIRTLIVNVAGSFLLAFLYTYVAEGYIINEDVKLGIGTGFLGAFTTFSTLCKENVALLHSGNYIFSIAYISISIFLGLVAVYLGYIIAKSMPVFIRF